MIKRALSALATAALLLWAFAELHELPAQTVTPSLGIYSTVPRGQLPGTTTNDSATAGNIGEDLSNERPAGSAVALTTATPAQIATVTLTPGNWEYGGTICFDSGATTTVTILLGIISTTSASISGTTSTNTTRVKYSAITLGSGSTCYTMPIQRAGVAANTPIYLNAYADFATSTLSGWGNIWAERRR